MSLERLRIFISSPGDVAEERVVANRLVRRLSDEYLDRVFIEPVFWEHEPLLASGTFQKQIPPPSECQVAICILWSRLGTRLPADMTRADGSRYASGTEYEFENAFNGREKNGYPDLLVYRKTTEPVVSLKDEQELLRRLEQKKLLDAFIQKWFFNADGSLKAAFHQFETTSQFELILEEHLRKLILRRLPAGSAAAPAVVKPSWTAGSPFRGLDVFDFQHAPVFFGRTQAAADVLGSLRKNAAVGRAFVLIVGVSGGGKSSLARAGVLPVLILPGVIEGVGLWRRAILKPSDAGGDLLRSLASSLLTPEALPELAADGTTAGQLADLLRRSADGAFGLVKGALSQAAARFATEQHLIQQPEARLVLLVDQLEELFTLRNLTPKDREAFIAVLSSLARSGTVWVMATLRGDFYHRLFELPELGALKEGPGQYDLPLPAPAEIAQMIRMPARAAGLTFEEDPATHVPLDEVVREAASSSPESLPLLEFALEELYQRRTPQGVLSYAAYKDLGGVEGALARRADAVFAALPLTVQDCLPRVMRGLVSIGPASASTGLGAGTAARQQASLASVAPTAEAQAFVEAFVQARLFTADRTEGGNAVVRVTHEALLRNWPRVIKWLEQDRELLIVRARVSSAAARWEQEGRRSDLLLGEGKPLAEAEGLAATLGDDLPAAEQALIAASGVRRQRVRMLRRVAVSALIVLTFAAGLAATVAQHQREIAADSARRAIAGEQQANEAHRLANKLANENGELAARNGGLADHLRRTLSETDARTGHLLLEQHRDDEALTYEARALDPSGSNQSAVADSVALLQRSPLPLLVIQGYQSLKSAAFNSDGTRVITAGLDNRLRMWDAATGKPWERPMRSEDEVLCIAFSSDGTRLVTVGVLNFRDAQVRDATTGNPIGRPMQHANWLISAAFSPDGARVVTTSSDKTTQVWDAATGKPLGKAIRHGRVTSAAFSPDGRRVVTASHDRTARVWDAMTGHPLAQPMRHDGPVRSAAFSPDGKRVATASEDMTARVWDAATGIPLTEPMRHDDYVHSASFSLDGLRVVTASEDKTARVWNAATGEHLGEPMRHWGAVRSAGFSPDGKRVLTASADKTARLWDAATGKPLDEPMRHEDTVNSAVFSRDGTRVVTASKDKTARVWDAATSKPLGEPIRHDNTVDAAAFNPGGTRVVTASDDAARVWDAATGKPLGEPMRHESAVHSADFSPDGTRVLTASAGGTARVWDAATGKPLGEPMVLGDTMLSAAFNSDCTRVVTVSGDKTAQVWNAATGERLGEPMRHENTVNSAAFSRDGTRVVTASQNKTRMWDAATGKLLGEPMRHDSEVLSAAFGPDGTQVVTANNDKTARVWDSAPGKPPGEPMRPLGEPMRLKSPVLTAAFSPDGTRVLTASGDDTARVWDVAIPAHTDTAFLAQLDQLAVNRRLSADGFAEPLPDWVALHDSLKRQAESAAATQPSARWMAWFLADHLNRNISPFSALTVSKWISNRLDENTPDGIRSAWEMDPTNARCLARLARSMMRDIPKAYPAAVPIYVELYSRRAVELAPKDADVVWRRAAMLAWLGRRIDAEKLAGQCPPPAKDDLWAWEGKWEACVLLKRDADAAAALTTAQELAKGRSKFIRDSLEQNAKEFRSLTARPAVTQPATLPTAPGGH